MMALSEICLDNKAEVFLPSLHLKHRRVIISEMVICALPQIGMRCSSNRYHTVVHLIRHRLSGPLKFLDINLDAVPKKYEGLDGTELAISESQERMVFVINPDDVELAQQICDKHEIVSSVIGEVIEGNNMIISDEGEELANLPTILLADPPSIDRPIAEIPEDTQKIELKEIPALKINNSDRLDLIGFIISLITLVFGLIYAAEGTKATSIDYEISAVESEISDLNARRDDLAVEKARLTSVATAKNSTVAAAMEDATVTGYAAD